MEENNLNVVNTHQNSYFDGGLGTLIGHRILAFLITAGTCGIGYPFAICMLYGWEVNHTVIEGRRLKFTGTGAGLMGNWIKWFLLCIITFGIYSFWISIKIQEWKVKNTIFAD